MISEATQNRTITLRCQACGHRYPANLADPCVRCESPHTYYVRYAGADGSPWASVYCEACGFVTRGPAA